MAQLKDRRKDFFVAGLLALSATAVMAQQTLITNVHVFDGLGDRRIENASVLVEGNRIKSVTSGSIAAPGARVIDGGGRTLMPGLIDNHWHTMFAGATLSTLLSRQDGYINLIAAREAEATLLRGFTTSSARNGANSRVAVGTLA